MTKETISLTIKTVSMTLETISLTKENISIPKEMFSMVKETPSLVMEMRPRYQKSVPTCLISEAMVMGFYRHDAKLEFKS
jgi:hypothetical protein